MTRSTISPLSPARAPRVSTATLLAVVLSLAGAAPAAAGSCEIWGDQKRTAALAPSDLPETLIKATLRCGQETRSVAIWTLKVDAAAEHLGVRDAPLHRHTGRLSPIAEAEIPGAARVTVLVRAGVADAVQAAGARAPAHRRFATFCDGAATSPASATPLDCSLNGARVKARATARDVDHDGVLDGVDHEISLYLGADRLHVVFFSERYRDSALSGAATWIDVLTSFGVLPSGA